MSRGGSDSQSIKSAKRALELLELFEKLRRPVRVSEMSEMLGYPQSSTSALLHSLKALGYLIYNPDERSFAPSLRVALLGSWLQSGTQARNQIFELLSAVRDATGEVTILSTRNGIHVQYICTLDIDGPVDLSFRPGTLRPLVRTAPGLILLEELDDSEIGRIMRRLEAEDDLDGEGDPFSLSDVMRHIENFRKQGYLALSGTLSSRFATIAMRLPMRDVFDKTLVIGVSGPARRIADNQQDILAIMRDQIARFCD